MSLPPFKLEEYFARHEFSCPWLLSMSDCEPYSQQDILSLADSECQSLWDDLSLGYTETQGLPLLREEIAKQYPHIPSENILCHAGAEEALYCTFRSLLNPGDHVIVITPCYQSLETLPQTITGSITPLPLNPNGWDLDIDQLQKAITPQTKMLVMNYPHNPTGALIDRNTQEAIITLARQQDITIVCDEVYRLMEIDPNDRLPPIASVYEKGISISVLTKAYGLGGLRIGWTASQHTPYIHQIAAYKHYTSISNAASSEILALIALRNSEKLLHRNHRITTENFNLVNWLIHSQPLLSWTPPKGGCIGFVHLDPSLPIEPFSKTLIEQSGILLLPASIFSYPHNYFRIGFGRANLPQALNHFKKTIDCYNPSHAT